MDLWIRSISGDPADFVGCIFAPGCDYETHVRASAAVVLLGSEPCEHAHHSEDRQDRTNFCRAILLARPGICVPLAVRSEKAARDRTNMHSQGNRRNDPWAQKQIEQDEARRTNRCVRLLRPASSLLPLPGRFGLSLY